jgi:hypothetical protein
VELTIAISPGELIDRLTILEIRLRRIPEGEQRRHVVRAHDALSRIMAARIPASPGLAALVDALRSVNECLWDAEDALREHERGQCFDAQFIATARAVYLSNDRRSALKRQIDELLGSPPGEEKTYASRPKR